MKMREKLGFLILFLGIAAGDSVNLLIPAGMVALGIYLLKDVIFDEAR